MMSSDTAEHSKATNFSDSIGEAVSEPRKETWLTRGRCLVNFKNAVVVVVVRFGLKRKVGTEEGLSCPEVAILFVLGQQTRTRGFRRIFRADRKKNSVPLGCWTQPMRTCC
ncbi:hypothetical protein MLD38_013784 [Melastoma candidum]|uniref:Uncharacterized protein n=1 Tax=Melastoma candidum TaxID=119954 RepID=A0ACB9RBZ2_9MYRT|nr:hypothetical protein MLD38_013784 [Melastoma candidum]